MSDLTGRNEQPAFQKRDVPIPSSTKFARLYKIGTFTFFTLLMGSIIYLMLKQNDLKSQLDSLKSDLVRAEYAQSTLQSDLRNIKSDVLYRMVSKYEAVELIKKTSDKLESKMYSLTSDSKTDTLYEVENMLDDFEDKVYKIIEINLQ